MLPEETYTTGKHAGRYHVECIKELRSEDYKRSRAAKTAAILEIKNNSGGCFICKSQEDLSQLTLNYHDPKDQRYSKGRKVMVWGFGIRKIREELKKGFLACITCSRSRTYAEKRLREGMKCNICQGDLKEEDRHEDRHKDKKVKLLRHHECHLKAKAPKSKEYADKMRAFFREARVNSGGCAKCGEKDPDKLEFAHFDRASKYRSKSGKTISICDLAIPTMKEELKKGRFLCGKCHEVETQAEIKLLYAPFTTGEKKRKYTPWQQSRVIDNCAYIDAKKMEIGKCSSCGVLADPNLLSFMHFDHTDPCTKRYNLTMLRHSKNSKQTIDEELAKVVLKCKPCHRKSSIDQGHHLKLPEHQRPVRKRKFPRSNDAVDAESSDECVVKKATIDCNLSIEVS